MEEIIEKIKNATNILLQDDRWLIDNDLSERSISFRLGYYLQNEFSDYSVDCEYNGNPDDLRNRKKINIIRGELERLGLLKDTEIDENVTRTVFPDIIIHKRGTNYNNIAIIEMKKSTNKTSHDYDFIKLQHYTSDDAANGLCYKVGIFLEIHCGNNEPGFSLETFINGRKQQ